MKARIQRVDIIPTSPKKANAEITFFIYDVKVVSINRLRDLFRSSSVGELIFRPIQKGDKE